MNQSNDAKLTAEGVLGALRLIEKFERKEANDGSAHIMEVAMPDSSKSEMHRFRQAAPGKFDKFAVKKVAPGIEFVMGIAGGKSEVQSALFDKEKFTVAQAKKWLADHDMKTASEGAGNPAAWIEDARLDLYEGKTERVNVCSMEDEELLAARKKFATAKAKVMDGFDALEDSDKYSTSAGRQMLADADYYSRILSGIEYEMQYRHLVLENFGR